MEIKLLYDVCNQNIGIPFIAYGELLIRYSYT